jgi:polysaccharide pyruvyl transferase WcaK-like protein
VSGQSGQSLCADPRAPRRVWLINPCGMGNLGDAAIVAAAIDNIRRRVRGVDVRGITINPADTKDRHGISSMPLGWLDSRRLTQQSSSYDPIQLLERTIERVRGLSWRVYRALRMALNFFVDGVNLARWSFDLGRDDLVIVCGGGQLDEFWGGAWGHPYSLWKLATIARIRGARVVVLSTGHGTLRSGIGRWFVRRLLTRASYVSYRTEETQHFVRQLGFAGRDSVVPDLAFSLTIPPAAAPASSRLKRIAVSPIAWCDPRSWPEKDDARFQRYLDTMTRFVRRLLDDGYHVVLFATDRPDHQVVADIVARLNSCSGDECGGKRTVSPAITVEQLFDMFRGIETVVASRLHGIILSYLAGIPTVAVSYDPKVDWLVDDFTQNDYLADIATVTPEELVARLRLIEARLQVESDRIAQIIDQYQCPLANQYGTVLGLAGQRLHASSF